MLGAATMPFKILVVEDKTDSRDLLQFFFTTRGFHVVTASDGAEGLHITQAEKPDLIITDLTMPNGSGVEMIKQIRSEPGIAHIPIGVYTAYGKDYIDSAIEVGANKVFSKPVNLEKLARFVTEFLNKPTQDN
jgi:CheY-like chemotaxis protein